MNKTIVTAAITGAIHIPSQSEYLPITPDEIADEAIASYGPARQLLIYTSETLKTESLRRIFISFGKSAKR